MLAELQGEQADNLLPFARPVGFHLCCSAVLQGVSPGRVFADDSRRPNAGFVLSAEGCYLIGDPGSAAFADGLRELLLSPDGLRIPLPALHFLVSSPPWDGTATTAMSDHGRRRRRPASAANAATRCSEPGRKPDNLCIDRPAHLPYIHVS